MKLSDFDYDLPPAFIAQSPVEPRDSSRLLVLNRENGTVSHHIFRDIVSMIAPGDVLVLNTTRVIPARLRGIKAKTGGAVEILLLHHEGKPTHWRALIGGKRIGAGTAVVFPPTSFTATIVEEHEGAERTIVFDRPVHELLETLGETPLPPYIYTPLADSERYQTVYSRDEGSAAAPTAGLHFTGDLLLQLRDKGVHLAYCVLHIGLDTFQPVQVEHIEQHRIHSERALLTAENARIINDAKLAGGRVIAVGTTTARTLETAAVLSAGGDPANPYNMPDTCPWRPVIAFERSTELYIYPGYRWRVVDALITNFHLPRSTLLMLVSSFAGRERVLAAYEEAKQHGYRFYSFGDAMFIC